MSAGLSLADVDGRIRETRTLSDDPALGRAAALTAVLEPALARAAGEGGRTLAPLSLALDLAAPAAPGATLEVSAWTERATRTLVFAAAEARTAEGELVAAGSAVFRVEV